MVAAKFLRPAFPRSNPVVVIFLAVSFFCAQPLLADEETVTAFGILESYVQSRPIPLETEDRGIAAFGVVAGVGLVVGLTWGGLLPALNSWDPSDYEFEGYGFLFGLTVGGAAQILSGAIGRLAYPRDDMRTAYSSVLDVIDTAERENAAIATLEGFSRQSRNRRKLGGILSFVTISAPIAAYLGINYLIGNLGEYADHALGFSAGAGLLLLGSLFYLLEEDEQALLYQKYIRSKR